ncbi:hypothetical protein X927_07490 [Petrotoga mexicana DSM 14811]|uniref:Uncharacterized protein n=1 Tax=Petrotoga mexicana DSM 14811 TaxID=1122954 RepID=A0A2K1P7R0_9BACT|nr:hypothetical protein X927_07490 [Petrotoga mexicana DSM 14811]
MLRLEELLSKIFQFLRSKLLNQEGKISLTVLMWGCRVILFSFLLCRLWSEGWLKKHQKYYKKIEPKIEHMNHKIN